MAQEYKLKGLSSLDLKPGEKREVEVEGVDEGKVLLCNVGGRERRQVSWRLPFRLR